jgi:hypothetical protein
LIRWAPGAGCEITLPETEPPSDVPDEVALREPYRTCGTDRGLEDLALMRSASETIPNTRRRCFLEANMNGRRAELVAYEPTEGLDMLRRLIYRSEDDGSLTVFYQQAPNWESWFHYGCAGLEEAPTGYAFEPVGCDNPEPLE